ncbi:MAG: ABC-type multidrug transport system, ATPase component [Fibrobacteres bacterium]|nr:ABC-type multidrug transport system, ATPase component [Fibrobacterota bacterium]
MDAPSISCKGLELDYGRGSVIGPITLDIPAGACVALVGENGAGKSSFIHMILGLRPPSRGSAALFGESTSQPAARRGIGYLQESVDFPERARAHDLIALHSRLTGLDRREAAQGLEAYLDGFGLELTGKPIRAYSKGMKQRLALAIAMLDCGRLLILDEPNSGLDPVGIAMLRGKLDALKASGTTLLISTHRLAEVMHLADQVLVLHKGKVAGSSPMSDFQDFNAFEKYFLERVR